MRRRRKRITSTEERNIPSPSAGSKRGCLCKDNTYSTKCCDGSLRAQGIGKTRA